MAKSMMDMITSGGKAPKKGASVSAKKSVSKGKPYAGNTNPAQAGYKSSSMKMGSAGKMKKGDKRLS